MDDFEQFLEVYSASSFAVTARHRRDSLRRAREEEDWQGIVHERHATPIITFVRRYPDGRRVRDAIRLLEELPGKVEEEAWAGIKDCKEPIVFEAFLAAFPDGPYADEALARQSKPLHDPADASKRETVRPIDKPEPVRQRAESVRTDSVPAASVPPRRRWAKAIMWTVITLLALGLIAATTVALSEMTYESRRVSVSQLLLTSTLAAGGIALMLMAFRPPALSSHRWQRRSEILFILGDRDHPGACLDSRNASHR